MIDDIHSPSGAIYKISIQSGSIVIAVCLPELVCRTVEQTELLKETLYKSIESILKENTTACFNPQT